MIGLSGKKSVDGIKIKIIGKSKVSITSTELEELLGWLRKLIQDCTDFDDWIVVGRRVDRFAAQRSLWRESFS